jgi:hypothetical protein
MVRFVILMLAALAVTQNTGSCELSRTHPHPPLAKMTEAPWLGPAISGSWYDPARSGEGFTIQHLASGGVLATWFTYPVAGEAGNQAWLISDVGFPAGDQVRMPVLRPQGARFGSAFNPADVQRPSWGEFTFRWIDCNTLRFDYRGEGAYGSGGRELKRLSNIDQANCNLPKQLTSTGARALDGLRGKSGAWFVQSRSGEGWFFEELPDQQMLVYWFTYDPNGNQAWLIGQGARSGNRVLIDDMRIASGTRFGGAFQTSQVQLTRWGSMTLNFSDCNNVSVSYQSTLPGYGEATRNAQKLASVSGASCLDGAPVAKTNGTWVELPRSPGLAQSEHAEATWNNEFYLLGGFNNPRGFKRFNPQRNVFEVLPDMPVARDHAAAFGFDGAIYFSGGNPTIGMLGDSAYRFHLATNTWEPRPELSFNFGSHAVVLNGYAYIGDTSGLLTQYEPRSRRSRVINAPVNSNERDHAQVVAFNDEIWVIGGRFPETRTVSIFDPISETWRAGPPLGAVRGGFAAAVVDQQIVVSGGEVLSVVPFALAPTTEVFTAGGERWRNAPNLPLPLHGTVGFGFQGEFFVMDGSTRAGSAMGATGRSFKIRLEP